MAAKARVQKRLYYKIGEACKELGIQPYVLRYWETEFPALSPSKSRSGQRVYSEKELEIIRRVKQLLYDEGYTIAGAKKKLEGEIAAGTLGEPGTGATAAASLHPPIPGSSESPGAGRPATAARPANLPGAVAARSANPSDTVAVLPDNPPALPAPASNPPGAAAAAQLPLADPAPKPGTSGRPAAGAAGGAGHSPDAWATLPLAPPASRSPSAAAAAPDLVQPRNATAVPSGPVDPAGRPPGAILAVPSAGAADRPARAAGPHAAAVPAAPPSEAPAPGPLDVPGNALDTGADKRIETLRKGIQKALQEAREILALLDSRSPQ